MSEQRIYRHSDFLQPCDGEPIRSLVTQSEVASVVVWYVKPGQSISNHCHPHGQDTWIVLSGHGQYQLDLDGQTTAISAGDIVIAHNGELHGVYNDGDAPLVFVGVVSPPTAGFQPL